MQPVIDKHISLFREMINIGVDFIVIGGYAVNYYGYNRFTGDIDVWLRPENGNRDRFITALRNQGFSQKGILAINNLDFTKHIAFHTGINPLKMDFITRLSGVTFDKAFANVEFLKLQEISIPMIGFNDLILSKMVTIRGKDKIDIEELQKIRNLTKGK